MALFNMGVQVQLPDPATTPGAFTVNMPPGADYRVNVIGDSVYLHILLQSSSTIPSPPPTSPITFQYRVLNASIRSDTATQYNNFAGFVQTSTTTYLLVNVAPIT